MRKKIGEDRTCSSEDMIADRQTHTHRQTRSSQYSAAVSTRRCGATAIHGARDVAVRRRQHPGERIQQLARVRHDAARRHVPLCTRRRQVRQQVLARRALLRHRIHSLHLRRHLHLAPRSRTAVRPSPTHSYEVGLVLIKTLFSAPLKLRLYGPIQICLLLLLFFKPSVLNPRG